MAGRSPVSRYVDVAADDNVSVTLVLSADSTASTIAVPHAPAPKVEPESTGNTGATLRTIGWITTGASAVGAVTFGLLAMKASSNLEAARASYPTTSATLNGDAEPDDDLLDRRRLAHRRRDPHRRRHALLDAVVVGSDRFEAGERRRDPREPRARLGALRDDVLRRGVEAMITRMKSDNGARGGRLLVLGVAALVIASAAACSVLLDHDADAVRDGQRLRAVRRAPVLSGRRLRLVGPRAVELLLRDPAAAVRTFSTSAARRSAFRSTAQLRLATRARCRARPPRGRARRRALLRRRRDAGDDAELRRALAGAVSIYITGSSNFPPLLAKLAPLIIAYRSHARVSGHELVHRGQLGLRHEHSGSRIPTPAHRATTPPTSRPSGTPVSLRARRRRGPGRRRRVGHLLHHVQRATRSPAPASASTSAPSRRWSFVVPGASQQTAITAEAARAVFGDGGNGNASPWTNPVLYFVRNAEHRDPADDRPRDRRAGRASSGGSIGHRRERRRATSASSPTRRSPSKRSESSRPTTTTSDRAQPEGARVRGAGAGLRVPPRLDRLQEGQAERTRRPLPDLGPDPLLHRVLRTACRLSPGAAGVRLASSRCPNPPQSLLDAFIGVEPRPVVRDVGQRASELGPLSSYTPPFQCGCYFEASPASTASSPAGCTACTSAVDCTNPPRPACNLGYCEVQ